ncbi:MAG: nucleotidyltransferase domain-containing protein [Candidatus Hodarchaeales archaeon]|jgi:predicted nucleotidyltransferase
MSKLSKAINFVRKIKDKSNILSIVLFGSVATGDDTMESDIDIAIIYDQKDQKKEELIDAIKDDNIQVTHLNLDGLKAEVELQDAIAGDGILLFGTPITIMIHQTTLKPKMILVYDTSNCDQKTKMKLHRALYGGKSTFKTPEKSYSSSFKGITKELNVKKLARSVLYCDRKNAFPVIRVFKTLNVRWKEISIWAYE